MPRLRAVARRWLHALAIAAAIPLLAGCDDPPVDLVSEEAVEAMGLQAWEEIRATTPVANEPELQRALDRVSARLLRAAGEDPGAWEILVFDSPEANAFALPGRKIGVFAGMFRVADSPDQLAAIVGHEIGHLQAEHGQERISAQVGADWGLSAIALLLNLAGVEYAAEIAAALGLGVEYGLVLPYSRGQELEADRLGLSLMPEAGFDPHGAVELWQRMERLGGPTPPAFLATHPAPADRIEEIRKMLPELEGN